jgi:tRNA(Ile)-lysidine synthase
LPEAAAALAKLIPRDRLEAAVRAWGETAGRGRWGVGFSGGADSLALLLLLCGHWPERRRRLVVLHFNHRLRGAASRADAVFCRRVCAELGVRCIAEEWREPHVGASEGEAREARLAFFRRHARVVWLGHQQDDVAESLLMRLARGSGAGGLAAPRPVQQFADGRVHLRPLLGLKKEEIVVALRKAGARWREDASNRTGAYFRNRVRLSVLPAWVEAAQRDALAGAARSRALLEEDDAALEQWIEELDPVDRWGRLRLEALREKPRALWRRALHRWLAANPDCGEWSRQAFDALLAKIEAGHATRQSAGRLGFAVADGRFLRFERIDGTSRRKGRRAN